MEALPEELRFMILSYLDMNTIQNTCTIISKTWLDMVRSEQRLSRYLTVKYELEAIHLNKLLHNWKSITVLEVPKTTNLNEIDLSPCPYLENVVLYGYSFSSKELHSSLPIPSFLEVKKLRLDIHTLDVKKYTNPWSIEDAIHLKMDADFFQPPNFVNVKIESENGRKIAEEMINLETLEVKGQIRSWHYLEPILEGLAKLKNLFHLDIKDCEPFLPVLQKFQIYLEQISHLQIRNGFTGTIEELSNVFDFKKISKLNAENLCILENDLSTNKIWCCEIPLYNYFLCQGEENIQKRHGKFKNLLKKLSIWIGPEDAKNFESLYSGETLWINPEYLEIVPSQKKDLSIYDTFVNMKNMKNLLLKLDISYGKKFQMLSKELESALMTMNKLEVLELKFHVGDFSGNLKILSEQIKNCCKNLNTIKFVGERLAGSDPFNGPKIENFKISDDSIFHFANLTNLKYVLIDTCSILVTKDDVSKCHEIESLHLKDINFIGEINPMTIFLSKFPSVLKITLEYYAINPPKWREIFKAISLMKNLVSFKVKLKGSFTGYRDHDIFECGKNLIEEYLRRDIEINISDNRVRGKRILRGNMLNVIKVEG